MKLNFISHLIKLAEIAAPPERINVKGSWDKFFNYCKKNKNSISQYYNVIKYYFNALTKAQKYDNIILLGYNCEIAYRFFKQYHFIDSSLFAWSYVTLAQLKYFLDTPQKVGINFFRHDNMFCCQNSGILFHGKTDLSSIIYQIDGERLNKEIEELRGRIVYLKSKFFKYSTNGKSTLYIIKLKKQDIEDPNFNKNIIYIYNKLKSICINKFKLLLIVEKEYFNKTVFNNPEIITRFVATYSPDNNVTGKNLGDKLGWKIIFTEFQPAKKKKQTKKFKFEECN